MTTYRWPPLSRYLQLFSAKWGTDTKHGHACVPKHFSAQARSRHFLMSRTAFEKEKELTDRVLKLAEIGKPKSNWELQGILGVADFVLGFLVGKQFILMRDLLLIDGLFRLSLFPPFPCMELGVIPM